MKLYVFLVNTGTTLTFDTELAVQTVADLKHAIQTKYKIATQHQVLVVNGGECMVADRRVCSYSAGTDTNPIFLYNKEMILCDRAPTIPKTTFSAENEMGLKVEESLMMPAVFHTVASRTQLAVEMYEVAKKLCSFCERLVHDEHLQHQGWAAIMANLEDCTHSFQKLLAKFENAYSNYERSVEDIKQKLTNLGTAVSVMAKIPLLECLTRHSYRECQERLKLPTEKESTEKESTEEETEDERSSSSVLCSVKSAVNRKSPSSSISFGHSVQNSVIQQEEKDNETNDERAQKTAAEDEFKEEMDDQAFFNVSLLDWINVQDRPNDVESLVRKCFDSMNRLDPEILQPFLTDCRETIAKLDNQNMKAIKGLEDRLYALDQMIASCNRLVNEQKELAQGFLANQKRAENLKDPSVLPDLCLSHANQLMIMLTNHKKLLDIKQKCTTAKQELANNLQVRLKWCCYVMLHADQNGEKLQALLRLLTELQERVRIVEALSTVPQMYCLAVVEVVRRKMFTKHYREWTSALVKEGKQLYEAERAKRESFGKLFRRSFLRNRLFRGLDSWPPSSFCTYKPRKFDFELPDVSLADLQFLQSCCPSEVQPFLRIPTLCDFEPLHQHIQILRNLVKAAQSLDEMSQTITDLLTEQKVSLDQPTLTTVTTHRLESTIGTKTTSSRATSTLSLQGPICPPANVPASLEELSPDSIDAHTFDFETIPHPNLEQVLKQGSIDMDSLAESPESDFVSAVNEFMIEENLTSPNLNSDPQSPEMMLESLYSSVINAIDNRRMQDTTFGASEDSKHVATLKVHIEKYRLVTEMSQLHFINIKKDLNHFRALVQKEQCDFSSSMKNVSEELRSIIETVKCRVEAGAKENYQQRLEILRKDYEDQIDKWNVEAVAAHQNVEKLKKDLLELENCIKQKDHEIATTRTKSETLLCLQISKDKEIHDLMEDRKKQETEMQELRQSKASLLEELNRLNIKADQKMECLREELQNLEQSHLKDLEDNLKARHQQEMEKLMADHCSQQEQILRENETRLDHVQQSLTLKLQEREQELNELKFKVSELSDFRCKLEVDLALKEAETEEIKQRLKENQVQQEEITKCQVMKETEKYNEEITDLKHQLQIKIEEYKLGLAEERTLMTIEKDRCIAELLNRQEEEKSLLKSELSKWDAMRQQSLDVEATLKGQVEELSTKLEECLKTVETQKKEMVSEKQRIAFDMEAKYKSTIHGLQEEKEQLLNSLSQEREKFVGNKMHEDCEQKRQALEQELQIKNQQLESQFEERNRAEREVPLSSASVSWSPPPSAIADLTGKFQEEKANLLDQLEKRNEELQSLKTSLIAEQQTNFNTVLTREKIKREQIIHELNDKLKKLTQQQEKDRVLIETLSADRATLLQEKKKLDEELNRLRSNVLICSAFSSPGTSGAEAPAASGSDIPFDSERLAPVTAVVEDGRIDSALEASTMTVRETIQMSEEKHRIMILERTLQMKEEENKRLNQRLMSQSMSSVSSRHSDKIAIRDFQVGDLVLIILDERHDNYVLFTVGPTLYFLHSESLGALDLKPVPGSSRRPWVLGKVMEKEYCQAKKAQNRFKVPLGTKFYRVKAVSWNKKV
ncbi:RB1-inducible coiled-coil protein 1 isoform X1 [Carcharodon carcharias]|uniref:RB1-inducible coiled-coil protein 1 isoform X1 n=1 Tax=Carcharodon carcharias TaxID=13397 RepID=UPI001B7F592B|nr:RB1-inducible coiled-coil protein 1 isoform X1 [Carcharodon carcharias]